jgi:alpha-L-fucosidase 2
MTQASTRLLYKRPAKVWNEALPIGNGTLGGMIYGGVREEKISLNHDELWSGYPKKYDDTGKSEYFRLARQYVLDCDIENATKVIENNFLSGVTEAYMPLGDLIIKFNNIAGTKNYRRSLDLSKGVASVEFETAKTKYTREIFSSYPDKLIAIKLAAYGEEKLKLSITFACQLHSICGTDGNKIYISGECPSATQHNGKDMPEVYYCEDERRGIQFLAGAAVHTDGKIYDNLQSLEISDASEIIIYFTAETSFNGYDRHPYLQGKEYKKPCIERLRKYDASSYETILNRHITDYKNLYDRVSFDLGSGKYENASTDYRLKNFQKKKDDIELCVLLFNFGRYLSIAASREGSQPSNLQGIWNNKVMPPWRSNYTININTEMNYWPVLMCSMPEVNAPLIEMIKEISVAGEKTARDFYDAPGFVCHHNTDLWRFTRPVPGSACWGFWSLSSGWFCHHLFE